MGFVAAGSQHPKPNTNTRKTVRRIVTSVIMYW